MGVILHYESATYSRWLAKFTPFVVEHVGRAMAAHGGGDESAEQPIAAAAASELSPQGESALRAALAGGLKIELPIELGSVWRFPWYLNAGAEHLPHLSPHPQRTRWAQPGSGRWHESRRSA